MKNKNLNDAKNLKNDEFYTLYEDIENEMNFFLNHKRNLFKDKVVLLPTDSQTSNFTKYFIENFERLNLKKLISTSYNGEILVITRKQNTGWKYLKGDGDFMSDEITKLRDEADIIITNPPFSKFRLFLNWLVEGNKKFLIVGSMNVLTYKEIYPLFEQNKISLSNPIKKFMLPDGEVMSFGNIVWLTNLPNPKQNKFLELKSMQENLNSSKHFEIREHGYIKYANSDAIDVPFVDAIPNDYTGLMGVPISFLTKYNPKQFEIVKFREGDNGKDLCFQNGNRPYFRILIKKKAPK